MSLFVAGAVLGEVQVLLFVVGAVFGECQVLLFVVGAALGECLNVRLGSKRCILQYFFLLHAAKVRSSCEEGPRQSALQSAYHDPQLDVTELKQNRTT